MQTISKHINNALREELADEVVVAKFANDSLIRTGETTEFLTHQLVAK